MSSYQSVWPLNELGEIVIGQGVGTTNVVGFLNQDQIPVDAGGKVKFTGMQVTSVGSITDYGVVSSTTLDQTTAIQTAFTNALADGKTALRIPAGTYIYSNILTCGLSLIGAGWSDTLFKCNSVDGNNSRIHFGNVSNIEVSGIHFYSPNTTVQGTETAAILRFDTASYVQIHDNFFEKAKGACVLFRSVTQGSIQRNIAKNTYKDTFHCTKACDGVVIQGNIVKDGGDDMIAVVGYVSDGITPKNITIANNTLDGSKSARGIAIVGADNVVVKNNVITNPYFSGIYIGVEQPGGNFNTMDVNNVIIEGNTLDKCGYSGQYAALQISSGATSYVFNNIHVKNNIIKNSAYRAISVGASSLWGWNIQICGNTISDTTDPSGKSLTAGTGTAEGIYLAHCKHIIVDDNHIEKTGGYGIFVNNNTTGLLKIRGNLLTQINKNGISSIDVINVASGSTADRIIIHENYYNHINGYSTNGVERFVENGNPTITHYNWNRSDASIVQLSPTTVYTDTTVAPSASPWTYTNQNIYPERLYVTGGTVSQIDWVSNNQSPGTYNLNQTSGLLPLLLPGEKIKFTYTVAPTVTSIPVLLATSL